MISFIQFAQVLNIPQTPTDSNTVAIILNIVFAIAGAIALLVIVVAGFRFVISSGEPQKVATARQTIIYAVVGLIIIILAASIVNFVITKVVQ